MPATLWRQLQVLPGFLDKFCRNLKLDNFSKSFEARLPVVQASNEQATLSFHRLVIIFYLILTSQLIIDFSTLALLLDVALHSFQKGSF